MRARSNVVAESEKHKMQGLERSEHYSDRGHYAVMTRTTVVNNAQLTRITDHLRQNREDLAFSRNPPTVDNCRISGVMLGWTFNLALVRLAGTLDE
jgi:hypothetical protein